MEEGQHFSRRFSPLNGAQTSWILAGGGVHTIWDELGYGSDVTIINTDPVISTGKHQRRLICADATLTEFPNRSFALAFSNSLIEHLGTYDKQRAFAAEMVRLSERIWCQTPNKWFPIEPHYLAPMLHWLPERWQKYWMFRWFSIWGLTTRPTRRQFEKFRQQQDIRLMTRGELDEIFPNCQIITECFLGWPKSFIVIKQSQSAAKASPDAGESLRRAASALDGQR